jgi:hypothetical protein
MAGTALDKDLYDALNAVALKKMASAEVVADVSGHDTYSAERALASLAELHLVAVVGGSALPTDDAQPALVNAAAEHYDQLRQDPVVLRVADKFEDINSRFLSAMSTWQQVDIGGRKVANDHQDSAYDAKVTAKMEKLIERLRDLLTVLAERDPRFDTYAGRFDRALKRVDSGEIDYVSSPTVDSVHNVWFEFHEDLLRTLGRARKE